MHGCSDYNAFRINTKLLIAAAQSKQFIKLSALTGTTNQAKQVTTTHLTNQVIRHSVLAHGATTYKRGAYPQEDSGPMKINVACKPATHISRNEGHIT